MNESETLALVPRPPSALEKADPGAKRILSGMVTDTLALAKKGPPRSQRPLRIVSVDDEDWRLELVEMTISGYFKGVTVQSFRDAEEAWQELLRTDPDLLITDDLMGKHTGEEIVHRLADRKVAYPIIVINAYGPERDQWVSDCVKRGVDVTMLRVPYDLESLLRALETGLQISRDTTGPVEIAAQPRKARPLRIVTMDDEPFMGEVMKNMIQSWSNDARVLTFTDAEKALQELAREAPDLFTTDWNHPKHLCDEMFRLLAAKKVKCPIFVISASAEMLKAKGFLKEYAGLGLNITLLSKPITVEELRAVLLKHLGPGDGLKLRKGAP